MITTKNTACIHTILALLLIAPPLSAILLPMPVQASCSPMIAAGGLHSVGLKSDGTVVAKGCNDNGQCNVSSWTNITQISAGTQHTLGLKSSGTVSAKGYNYYGQCNVSSWTNITQTAAGDFHSAGLKSSGAVVAAGNNNYNQCNTGSWTNITQIAAGGYHTLGLKSNGTAVHAGTYGSINVSTWTGIEQVAAGKEHALGLKSDGTVVASGDNDYGQRNVSSWTDITQVAAGLYHSIGLKSDGTVVATGYNGSGQCNVSSWTDIIQVSTGNYHTLGFKSDGTVVSCGDNDYGQRNVSSWQLMTLPTITTGTATGVGNTSATLNLSYTVGNFPPVGVYFGYKKASDSSWTYTSPVSRTDDGDYAEPLTGLDPGTEYDFQAMLTYGPSTLEGSTVQFTTGRASPTVTSIAASGIGCNSATLNLSYTIGDYSPVYARFAYKVRSDSSWSYTSWVSRTVSGAYSETISGLISDSTYDFRGEIQYESSEIPGETLEFTTPRIPPSVTTLDAEKITTTSATLNTSFTMGEYNTINVRFGYKKHATDVWNFIGWVTETEEGSYQETITELAQSTQYDFRAEVQYDTTTTPGNILQFTTQQGIASPGIRTGVSPSPSPSPSPSSSASLSTPVTQPPVMLSSIQVRSATLSAERVAPGDPVTVTASIVNKGGADGAALIRLYVRGQEQAAKSVAVTSGGTTRVDFTFSSNEPGDYTVHVNSTPAGSFTVFGLIPDTLLYVSMCMIFSSMVIALIYIRGKRTHRY